MVGSFHSLAIGFACVKNNPAPFSDLDSFCAARLIEPLRPVVPGRLGHGGRDRHIRKPLKVVSVAAVKAVSGVVWSNRNQGCLAESTSIQAPCGGSGGNTPPFSSGRFLAEGALVR